jgi:hypothetical protein
MSGGADRASAQEDLGGRWTSTWNVYRERRETKWWDILPFLFRVMAGSFEQKPKNSFLFLHILYWIVNVTILFVTFVQIVITVYRVFTIIWLKQIVFLSYTILMLLCLYNVWYTLCYFHG